MNANNTPTTMNANEAATLKKYGLNGGEEFRYMMLDRLRGDCVGYLTIGDWRYHEPTRIWAHNQSEQIEIMRALWHSLPIAPEWLTLEQIDEYAKQMNVNDETLL